MEKDDEVIQMVMLFAFVGMFIALCVHWNKESITEMQLQIIREHCPGKHGEIKLGAMRPDSSIMTLATWTPPGKTFAQWAHVRISIDTQLDSIYYQSFWVQIPEHDTSGIWYDTVIVGNKNGE